MQQQAVENFNKYTIGKRFRRLKNLRRQDPTYIEVENPPQLQEYIDYLRVNGVLINKVRFGVFKTKNGLTYPGLVASEKILSNEVLVSVPKNMLLTTRHAYMSPIKHIFKEHPQFFSSQFTSSSEDRMLLTYLLYEYQRGRDSQWYHMIVNLPREIDYLVFWDEKEQQLLEDQQLVKMARKQKQEFILEYETLRVILHKYPNDFKESTYSFENVQWIYTHLVTRCFGKYLQYVTMVPFCELFNHECVDVYYDFTYHPDNPSKSEESEELEPLALTEEQQENITTSEGSYNSEDDESDSEYVIDEQLESVFKNLQVSNDFERKLDKEKLQFLEAQQLQFTPEPQGDKSIDEYEDYLKKLQEQQIKQRKDFNIKQSLQKEIYMLTSDIKQWMYSNLDYGDSFTIFFVAQIYRKVEQSFEEFQSGKKAYFMTREDMKRYQQTCVLYKNEIYKYNKDIMKRTTYSTSNFAQKKARKQKEEQEKQTPQTLLEQALDADTEYFQEDDKWEEDKFDNFIMKCSRKDQFEKHAQVYFCYGRLSNRMMLMRYGMTLEYNKYDHIHLRLTYLDILAKKNVPDLLQRIQNYNLSKIKRFKIKSTTFPIDFIFFCKAQYWTTNVHSLEALFGIQDLSLEIQALTVAEEYLQTYMKENFTQSVEDNEKLVHDPNLGYHELFAAIYRLERQRILVLQIKLVQIAKEIFKRMHSKGIGFDIAALRVHDLETSQEYQTHRLILAKYFSLIRFNFYIKKN